MKEKFFLILGVVIILGSILLFFRQTLEETGQTRIMEINGSQIEVEIAQTSKDRSQGLSGREELAEDSGMLFIFEKPGLYGFWMRAMNFPIDIIWLDENFVVVDTVEKASPESFPEVFYPKAEARYVLELSAGFVEQNNIQEGDVIQ